MKRAEFIASFARLVREGRRRNHPDMRPSEEAFSQIDDEKKAASLWRRADAKLKAMTGEQWEASQKVSTAR